MEPESSIPEICVFTVKDGFGDYLKKFSKVPI